MSSSQEPVDAGDVELDVDPTDRIKGFLARQTETYLDGPITAKEALEEYIQERRYTDHVQARVDDAFPELTDTVDQELEGDGRTRGLSDVLPPGEWPKGDVYQYVPRRELREYSYDCQTTIERIRRATRADFEREWRTVEETCRFSTTRKCRGLPTQCPNCGEWVRPEDDK